MRGFLSREISSKGNIWASASSSCRTAGEGGLRSSLNISSALSIMESLQMVKNTERLFMRVFLKFMFWFIQKVNDIKEKNDKLQCACNIIQMCKAICI